MTHTPASYNVLFYGDNLQILCKYIRGETVDLIYLDPLSLSTKNPPRK